MRFVSHSAGFSVQIIEERAHPTQYGDMIVDRDGYHAHFTQDDVTEADLAFAEHEFGRTPPGFTVTTDEVTPIPLLHRVSVFDTEEAALREGWSGRTTVDRMGNIVDFKTVVEQKLSERAVNHPDFRQLVELPVEPPWPNYLQFNGSLEQLLETLTRMGHDLHKVLAYEKQQGREQVAQAIQAEIDRQAAEYADAPQVPA